MAANLLEHGQFVDNSGKPLAAGKLYIGTNGADPVASAGAMAIYSDRGLTTTIANPQDLGSDGRTLNKVWVRGKYSIQVNDYAGVQAFQDLDAGVDTSTANSVLFASDVVGVNTITVTTADAISDYVSNQQFVFKSFGFNTGPVTLSVDGVGARALVKNHDQPLSYHDIGDKQVVIVVYNGTHDNFEFLGQQSHMIDFYKGADAASASDLVLVRDGNDVTVTGTATINTIDLAANTHPIGATVRLRMNAACSMVHNPLKIETIGGVDYGFRLGDYVVMQKSSATLWVMVGADCSEATATWEAGVATKKSMASPADVAASIAAVVYKIFHVRDEKPSGTAGGTFTSGAWQTRTLNTTKTNTITGASLATNQITLPAGTYDIFARSSSYRSEGNNAQLYNVTDATVACISNTSFNSLSAYTDIDVLVLGRITVVGTKVFELRHFGNRTEATWGFGRPATTGQAEVYSEVHITKVL